MPMILTCPACDTRYVIKDGAIPPGGRKVRCAACKHSWHQDPEAIEAVVGETVDEQLPNPLSDISGPPEPDPYAATPASEPGPHEIADQFVAEVPEPETTGPIDESTYGITGLADDDTGSIADHGDGGVDDAAVTETAYGGSESGYSEHHAPDYGSTAIDVSGESSPVAADVSGTDSYYAEQTSSLDSSYDSKERGRSKWPWLLGLLVLIAAVAAAFWFFAPTDWKNRVGIVQSGQPPLQLVITSKPDRQILSSGNELVSVSGKVTNPTNRDQDVPPIQATLRNSTTKKIIHRWTIAPPAKVLAPGSSASFNSAEVDIPSGGDELTIAWSS